MNSSAMKPFATIVAAICVLALLHAITTTIRAQASLTPPAGPPSADMKTIDEVEPRTPIHTLPFTISSSGSYYLTDSLAGTNGNVGITIAASDVTLDLNGFTLSGVPGSLDGVAMDGARSRIRIRNGIVRDWGADGIDATGGSECEFRDLIVSNNQSHGVVLGSSSSIKDCTLSLNASDGINLAGSSNVIEDNECRGNAQGFTIGTDRNVVRNNKTIGNSVSGFVAAGFENLIANNYTRNNGINAHSNQVLNSADNQYDLLISDIPETLNQVCNARLTGHVVNSIPNGDGITIDHDNVTLDLGGFTIFGTGAAGVSARTSGGIPPDLQPYFAGGAHGGTSSDDGIVVLSDQDHVTIRNGSVVAWGGDGINALNADHSLFEDLHVGYNQGDGLVADFNCIINKCTAVGNGLDGLEGDDGTVIKNCTSSENGDNGIQTSEGTSVLDCNCFNNAVDGIDVAAGSVVRGCSATDNGVHGFDIALGCQVSDCSAYDNCNANTDPAGAMGGLSFAGFDIASSCIVVNCHSALNNGHGFRTFANSKLKGCKAHENDWHGILISSTDSLVEGCTVTDNDIGGIVVTSSGCLIIRNRAAGNNTVSPAPGHPFENQEGNFNIVATSAFGPIVNVIAAGDISGVANSNHPMANLAF